MLPKSKPQSREAKLMLTNDQLNTLYHKAQGARNWAIRSKADVTWTEMPYPLWLYRLALDVLGVDQMLDAADVIPAIFGAGWMDEVKKVCVSEWWFWQIVAEWAASQEADAPLASPSEAIATIRRQNGRISFDVQAALSGTLSPNEMARAVYLGAVLWDTANETTVLNPLWFFPQELEEFGL
jgi:hypothetical protein